MGRASKIGAHFGPYRAGTQTARIANSLGAPISRPMAAPAQSRYADRACTRALPGAVRRRTISTSIEGERWSRSSRTGLWPQWVA